MSVQLNNDNPDWTNFVQITCENNYKKIKRLGRGAYGVVHEVLFPEQSKPVALKKFMIETNELTCTTLREISVLKYCSHPNILHVLHTFYTIKNDVVNFYMCTPVYSWTLRKYYLDCEYDSDQIKSIVVQLANGTDYLHTHGFIHRDLKPENIFVNTNNTTNNAISVVIGDFGLVRRYYNNVQPLKMTSQVCTLYYKSPELLLGICDYTTSSDMWSLGMIFSELLLKKRLCPGDSETDQLHHIFKLFGTPNHNDLKNILGESRTIPSFPIWPNTFTEKFSNVDIANIEPTLKLIEDILIIDPSKRLKRLIDHPYFSCNNNKTNVVEGSINVVSEDCNIVSEDCNVVSEDCNVVSEDCNVVSEESNVESGESSEDANMNKYCSDELNCVDEFPRPVEALLQLKVMYEKEEQIPTNFLHNHPDLSHKMVQLLIDWLTDVSVKFKLVNNTYHRCIQLIYKFLSVSNNIPRKKLQLVGITCMHISSKLEEIYGCEIKDMVYIGDKAYTQFDVEEMERIIIATLNFDFVKPMSIEFLRLYSHFSDFEAELHTASKFLLELALTSYELKSIIPSKLALYVTTKILYLENLLQEEHDYDSEGSPHKSPKLEIDQNMDDIKKYTDRLEIITKETLQSVINSEGYKLFDKFISNAENNIFKAVDKNQPSTNVIVSSVESTDHVVAPTIVTDNMPVNVDIPKIVSTKEWRWALYEKYKIRNFGVASKLYSPDATPLFPLTTSDK